MEPENSLLGGTVVLLVSLTILLVLKKSLWAELEILTGLLSLFMFAYFFLLLYYGVRFDKNEHYLVLWPSQLRDMIDATPSFDTGGTFAADGIGAGPLGMIVGFVLDLLVSLVLTFLLAVVLWLSMNVFVTPVVVLGAPLFFLFRRSVRYVVAQGRACHQDASRACWFALRATLVNTLWFYAILRRSALYRKTKRDIEIGDFHERSVHSRH